MLADEIKKIIAEQFGIAVTEISDETFLTKDLKADSLDVAELVLIFEDEFKIEIPDEDVEKMNTVGEITKYVEEKKAKATVKR